jgi:flagellin-specific chaperone FliS
MIQHNLQQKAYEVDKFHNIVIYLMEYLSYNKGLA